MVTHVEFLRTVESFSAERKFNGNNWLPYTQEFEMLFSFVDPQFWQLVTGKLSCPPESDKDKHTAWTLLDHRARLAIYKTIPVETIRATHCSSGKTAAEWWQSLMAQYQKDTRSARLEMKRRFYNPVHDPSQPVQVFIDSVTSAANDLASIRRSVDEVEIVDSIIMHLDESWSTVRTILTTRKDDPTLTDLRSILLEHQRASDLDPSSATNAMHSKYRSSGSGKYDRRKSHARDLHSGSDSDSGKKKFNWLNPTDSGDCHRCGRPGHKAKFCINDMPYEIKKQILRDRREHAHAAYRRSKPSSSRRDATSDSDNSDLDNAIANLAHYGFTEDHSDSEGNVVLRRYRPGDDPVKVHRIAM